MLQHRIQSYGSLVLLFGSRLFAYTSPIVLLIPSQSNNGSGTSSEESSHGAHLPLFIRVCQRGPPRQALRSGGIVNSVVVS